MCVLVKWHASVTKRSLWLFLFLMILDLRILYYKCKIERFICKKGIKKWDLDNLRSHLNGV